jgi:hypothetical protein
MKRNTEEFFESLAACSTLGKSIAAASQMVKGALLHVIIYLTAEISPLTKVAYGRMSSWHLLSFHMQKIIDS